MDLLNVIRRPNYYGVCKENGCSVSLSYSLSLSYLSKTDMFDIIRVGPSCTTYAATLQSVFKLLSETIMIL